MQGNVGLMLLVEWRPGARARGFARLALGGGRLKRVPGLAFAKSLGTGEGGGFGLAPSFSHHGIFASFADDAAADAFLESSLVDAYRADSVALFSLKLRAFSARGRWAGREPLAVTASAPSGPVAALTRGAIRPSRAFAFWRHATPSHRAVDRADGCLLSAGLGEAPLFRQATFSVWRDAAAMDAYARTGAHREAIRAASAEGHFSESLFARFVPYDARGTWRGRSLMQEAA